MNNPISRAVLCVCLVVGSSARVRADRVEFSLAFDLVPNGAWQLYVEVVDGHPRDLDGSAGIAEAYVTLQNIDFGRAGEAISYAADVPWLQTVTTGEGARPAIRQVEEGAVELYFQQNLADEPSVVTGIGASGRQLLASGTYGESFPFFVHFPARSGNPLARGSFFSNTTAPFSTTPLEPFSVDVRADHSTGWLGDINQDGLRDFLDIQPFVDLILAFEYAPQADFQPDGELDALDIQPFVNLLLLNPQPTKSLAAVPEPTSLALACLVSIVLACGSRRLVEQSSRRQLLG